MHLKYQPEKLWILGWIIINLNLLKITFINISLAFPDLEKPEVQKIAKMSLKESFRSYYETFYCFSRPNRLLSENILKSVRSKGFKYIVSAISYVFKLMFHFPLLVFDSIYKAREFI